jgi:tRNA threonylcarbamoyladenosine biosynthesis protein TsaE
MKIISKSLEDTLKAARSFVEKLELGNEATVVALSGDLGSGKTTFSQAVGDVLGVSETMQSPTFVIEKVYPINYHGFKNLIHIDAYRLESELELSHLGWEEMIKEPENLILVEWPEKVSGIIPSAARRIYFEHLGGTSRGITDEN